MDTSTFLLILLSILIAAGLSFFQYFYKAGSRSKVSLLLASLRFLAVLGILLLLINPKITRNTYETEKTPLPIVVDNSGSITDLKADRTVQDVFEKLSQNNALQDKFDVQPYRFDSDLEAGDTFNFKGRQTNLEQVARGLKDINRNKTFPTVIITDGNQTSGNDFVYAFDAKNKVYPVVAGDTTTFFDLRVMQVNVNKYAFYKNKFPAEVFLQYSGNKSVTADFSVTNGKSVVYRQSVAFSPSKRSAVVNVLLPANAVGLQVFRATLLSSEPEKNTYNNSKNFAVEIIDQKTEVAIVSSISHPDIGALKRAIETNAQRRVTVVKPSAIKSLSDYNVLILYQPTPEFRSLFEANKNAGANAWIVTGPNTDFSLLNQYQKNLAFRMSSQREDYLAGYNGQFNLFALDNIGFENFPPLQSAFGNVSITGNVDVLLQARIRNINTGAPLLAFAEDGGKRTAFLLGENIWKWRLQSHVDTKSFDKFDIFVDKTIQFLSSNNARRSLIVNHESFYNSGEAIDITAQFFNKNYEFDEKARLTIAVTNKNTKAIRRYDLLRTNNAFKVSLDGLPAGQYNFTVKELNSNTVYNGYFEILDFDIEKQFVNPDSDRLHQLAAQTNGEMYMPNQIDRLIETLLENGGYVAVQKAITKKVPLIDSILLLILIAILLASEWLIRKYNGML
ncbi:MAG TPA: hypothetical protein VF676_10230 [Flavobacterium sp.]|jgi:hypothetical protein